MAPHHSKLPRAPHKQEGEGCHGRPDGNEGIPPPDPEQIRLNLDVIGAELIAVGRLVGSGFAELGRRIMDGERRTGESG